MILPARPSINQAISHSIDQSIFETECFSTSAKSKSLQARLRMSKIVAGRTHEVHIPLRLKQRNVLHYLYKMDFTVLGIRIGSLFNLLDSRIRIHMQSEIQNGSLWIRVLLFFLTKIANRHRDTPNSLQIYNNNN
jgi:hypothetical protein